MLSFVVPARNEAPSLRRLCHQIVAVCERHGYAHEIVLVDDGSTDGTWKEILTLAEEMPVLRGVRLRRNFGKGPALSSGFAAARGQIVFMMDADLQDDPADVPAFLAALEEGNDVVVGWREVRRDSWFKRAQSKVFNAALGTTGLHLHDHNCGFKAVRAEVLSHVRLYGDMHRYLPVLAHIAGFRVGEVRVNHRPREFGQSNYGLGRTYRGAFDLLTILFLKTFRYRPMHFLGPVGGGALMLGTLGMVYLAILWLVDGQIGHRPLLIYSTAAAMLGAQILATGFIAELLTTHLVRREDLYLIKEQVVGREPVEATEAARQGAGRARAGGAAALEA